MSTAKPLPSIISTDEYCWVFNHYPQLVRNYPNEWVAFFGKQILAHGRDPLKVREQAHQKVKKLREIPLLFIEKGIHVY